VATTFGQCRAARWFFGATLQVMLCFQGFVRHCSTKLGQKAREMPCSGRLTLYHPRGRAHVLFTPSAGLCCVRYLGKVGIGNL